MKREGFCIPDRSITCTSCRIAVEELVQAAGLRSASRLLLSDTSLKHRPMPTYNLSAHVYCREFDDGAILLDLRSGRYLGINAHDLPMLKARVENWPSETKARVATGLARHCVGYTLTSELLARGTLTLRPTVIQRGFPPSPETSMTMTGRAISQHSGSFKQVLRLFLAMLQVRLLTGRGRLGPLLTWLERRQHGLPSTGAPDANGLEVLLSCHCRWRIWFYTAHNHCLFDSLVLSVFLTRNFVPCTFVIAVATRPFAAHAWVQIGNSVLNDTAEYAQLFQPLLGVGGGVV